MMPTEPLPPHATEENPEAPSPPVVLAERPSTIHVHDELEPRGPWSFIGEACSGGFSRWGIQLMAAWAAFQVLTSTAWAMHLRGFAEFQGSPGASALPNNWGERLTAGDIWELVENGGMKHSPFGSAAPFFAVVCLVWVFWAGWRMQTDQLGFKARLRDWFMGLWEGLLLGVVPIGIVFGIFHWALSALGKTGIQGLGWASFIGGPLLTMAFTSAVLLQWWLCRLSRGAGSRHSHGLLRHWGRSFLRLWMSPVQWTSLVMGGVVLRAALAFLVIWIGWRMGGGTPGRVQRFLLLEVLSAAVNAWLLGWFLRLTALFWRQDEKVRNVRLELELAAEQPFWVEPQATHEG